MNNDTCQGTKRDGDQCTRNAQEGSSFCWQHNVTVGDNPAEFPEVINRKEEGMPIMHFMRTVVEFPASAMRVVTTMPTPGEKKAYEASILSRGVEPIGNTGQFLQALDIGNQSMPLFQHRAVEMGVNFRFISIPVKALVENPEAAELWLSRSNFSWANSSTACYIKFDGVSEWGLEPLGLSVNYSRKLAKRLNEIARVAAHAYYGPVVLREFLTPEGSRVEDFDGISMISESFANKLGLSDDDFRGMIRIITPIGLIKGDFAKVPDANLDGADVVYHTENMKEELVTTGWYLTVARVHEVSHELRHDDQTRGNFSFFVTHDRVMADLAEMMSAFQTSLEEGDLAEYLVSSSSSYSDPIPVDYDRFGTAQRIEEQAEFLKEIGIAPSSFSNITFMRLNAIKNKMEAGRFFDEYGRPTKYFKKMAIPASNSMNGKVVTYEAMTLMGGIEFGQSDGSQTFLDSRYGVIMPAERFYRTYALHGGWDLDDSVSVFRLRVFCSDPARIYQLMESGVLDDSLFIPSEEDQAVEVGLMIRMPNGPGEYSIESIDQGAFGYFHRNNDTVEVVDLAQAPEDADTVYGKALITNIPVSPVVPGTYSRDTASGVITAQMNNPGVGSFVNMLMSHSITFEPGVIPDKLVGRVEQVVDAVEQTADARSFAAIAEDVKTQWVEFAKKVVRAGVVVDRSLWVTRIPESFGKEFPVGAAIAQAGLLGSGNNAILQEEYNKAIVFIDNLAKYAAAKARSETPLAARIRTEMFGLSYKAQAQQLLNRAEFELRKLNREFDAAELLVKDNAVLRRMNQVDRRVATENLMKRIVDGTMARTAVDPHRLVLALYKYIITPDSDWEFGRVDRIFVQPTPVGTPSMMHILIEALEINGLLIDIIDPV